jgi:hypothetical protein
MKNFVCVTLFILVSGMVHSEPMYIDFYEMMQKSTQIFIGTYVEPIGRFGLSHSLQVETILKGSLKPGQEVTYMTSGQVGFKKGDRVIAFINEDSTFEWVGLPVNKEEKEIHENTLLMLEGFYDFNAYIVGPSTLTLGQLKQYIKENKYDSKINGHLHCFSNQTLKMEKQEVLIEVTYTYRGKEEGTTDIKVNGMSWYDFPKKPFLSLGSWASEIELRFELNKYRSLTIVGKLEGKNNTNGINAYFWVQEPRELTFDELKEFILHENYLNPYYELELKTQNKGICTIELGREGGRIGQIKGYDGKDLEIWGIQDRQDYGWERNIVAALNDKTRLVLLLDSTKVTEAELEFTYEDFIRQLKIEGGKGKIVVRKGWITDEYNKKEDAYVDDFILTCKSTRFVLRNDKK